MAFHIDVILQEYATASTSCVPPFNSGDVSQPPSLSALYSPNNFRLTCVLELSHLAPYPAN